MLKREKRVEQLQIRLTSSEKKILTQEAEKSGLDVSTWVKQKIFSFKKNEFNALIVQIGQKKIRKTALATLNDFLNQLEPRRFDSALQEFPQNALNHLDANYVAAMVEVSAFQKGVNPPKWTMNYKGLDVPFFGTELHSLRPYLLTSSPIPFRRRNIFIDSTVGNRV